MSSTATSYNSQSSLFYSPPITIILTVILLICFFIFSSMYFCRCFLKNFLSTRDIRSPGTMLANSGALVSPGLDPALIQSFPAFIYSTVKDFRKEKYGLECSICLNEFNDEDFLRLLTSCYHVFHQECIDLWLGSHKTCPVCRRDLDLLEKPLDKSPILVHSTSMLDFGGTNSIPHDAISIEIKEDYDFRESQGECGASATKAAPLEEQKEMHEKGQRSLRPHSTGHSIISIVEEDRYTLRLIDNVKLKIPKGHNSTASCITFGDFSSPVTTRNGGDGAECSEENINRV